MAAGEHNDKDDRLLRAETELEERVGIFGPGSWARIGLVVLVIIAAILLVSDYLGGNKGTGVYPGTPIAAPQNQTSK